MPDKLAAYLNERLDDYLDDLRELVGIDSGSKDREGVQRVNTWLEARLDELGFSVERHPQTEVGDNLLATLEGRGAARILLLGHSDTVFPKGTAAQRPMTIQSDKIMGPGTCDMKAGLLTGLYAVQALQEISYDGFGRIVFLCVSDEEVEKRYSHDLIRATARQVDAALTLEAAREDGSIVVARKGLRAYTIEAFGHAAHAGVEPEKGRNAIVAMAHHVLALNQLNGYRPDATVNPGVIEGGSAYNVVPDYARLEVDLRAFNMDALGALIDAVAAQLEQETVPGVEMKMTLAGPGLPPMPRTPAVAALEGLAQEAAAELGFEVKGARTGGASDACTIAAEGRPVLDGLGPIGGLDHSPDEYILLSSIVPRTALLAKLITAIAERGKD
jgi:glutamate carboxypeptidase